MPRKQSSATLSTLAANILDGAAYGHADVLKLAGSVMSQDETKGQGRAKKATRSRKAKPAKKKAAKKITRKK